MPTIATAGDLLPLLGRVATEADPIAALARDGFTLAPDLERRLRQRTREVAPEVRRQWARLAPQAGRLTFSTGRTPQVLARDLAIGEFEVSAGVRMSVANEILAGLHANRTIPDILFLDRLLSPDILAALAGAFVVNRPGGSIGRLELTPAPTIAPMGEGLDRVALSLPFRLHFERIQNGPLRQLRIPVTFATGRLRLIVGLTSRVVPVSLGARQLELQVDLSQSIDARIDIDAGSPVQRLNDPAPGDVDGLAVILQNALQQHLAGRLRLSVSAAIPLPIGRLEIRQLAIVTRGDALFVGIKVQGTSGAGDPGTLTPMFPSESANFYTRVHDQVLRLIVQSAARSGELTQIARETHPDAVIESADVSFGSGTPRSAP